MTIRIQWKRALSPAQNRQRRKKLDQDGPFRLVVSDPMSLFTRIEKLYRLGGFRREDFLTEIVAQVLGNSTELTLDWLRWLNVTDLKQARVKIATQVRFEKLVGHEADSRPDMAISLVENGGAELVLIESKVDSKQGHAQLQRYADRLAAERIRKGLKRTALVSITRDYEAPAIVTPQDSSFCFRSTRWFEFYNKLKAHLKTNSDGLANQLKLFMEENRMSLGKHFRSTDVVAMENFLSARALMDETLASEVSDKARHVLGSVSDVKRNVDQQLRDVKRYYGGFKKGCAAPKAKAIRSGVTW